MRSAKPTSANGQKDSPTMTEKTEDYEAGNGMNHQESMPRLTTTHTNAEGAPLSRQVTVTMSNEQYERLFFQPSAPKKGDLAKRFGTFPID